MTALSRTAWPARLRPANLLFLAISLAGLAAFLYPFWAPPRITGPETRMLVLALSGAAGLILVALLGEAQAGLTAHTIAMLGTLVGLNTVLRVLETVVPLPGGFSPVFLLIVLVGYTFGARLGFLMGALTLLVSGPLTAGGLGPWTPYQMLAAGWVGMGAALLPRGRSRMAMLALYGAAWGWLYGALTNLYFWPYTLLAPDLSWQPGLSPLATLARYGRFYLVTSLAWDSMRALGNLVLILLLGQPLLKALERFRRRARVTWERG
ncbi:MAG: ECF transporter S component [Chloroflexota bacterium]